MTTKDEPGRNYFIGETSDGRPSRPETFKSVMWALVAGGLIGLVSMFVFGR
jgi:hypothetical protein